MTKVLLIGAGRMGGAMLTGWMASKAFAPIDLILCDPSPGDVAKKAAQSGAVLNPPDETIATADIALLAVKPQAWREAAERFSPKLAEDARLVSLAAGVRAGDLEAAFGGRMAARAMPTTAVAVGQGTATLFSRSPDALAAAHALFDPVARTVEVEDEALMDVATAVSGSGPAYLYAFVEALEAAGIEAGLPAGAAATLARSTIAGAAALMQTSGEDPAELRRQVTSPGGTTEAALKVLMGEGGLGPLLERAVAAAADRSRALAG